MLMPFLVGDDVILGINLELSSIVIKAFCDSNALTLIVSLIFNLVESVERISIS